MSSVNSASKFRVAIIGGGMGGLVLGLCLKKYALDVQFDIYESAAKLTEVGAGVLMSPRIWTIMQELELEEELVKVTGAVDRAGSDILFRKGDEAKVVDIVKLHQLHTFQRSVLQQILSEKLDAKDRIHFSKRLTSYSEPTSPTEPIILHFKDGTTATCDIVIGSDGIRSSVRRTMFAKLSDESERHGHIEDASRTRVMVEPIWSGHVTYRGLILASELSEDLRRFASTPQILCGKDRHVVLYPVSGGELVNIVSSVYTPGSGTVYDGPWVETTTSDKVAKLFEGFNPNAVALIKSLREPLGWALHTVPKLTTYIKGRYALIGDAAHAMVPYQGAGLGQAIEDGFVLAKILAHSSVTLTNVSEALRIYDDVRRPFSQNVQQGSEWNGMLYQLRRAGWEDISVEDSAAGRYPPELLSAFEKDVKAQMEWQYDPGASIKGDIAKVSGMLETLSAQ
ncbi:FAD/NAD(P)-binding domain-containing protein [Dichomitus squalens LYAD-421 SS1]|uniref:FAD/NAD(P)-binding domain-containing protein n=1 Tax=Dichomitus squalens (strain LYAD-421) TaxID=732165 RepID=R7T0Y1_DICSQ|nr:FAD/NAD(P)-binding domain-containing protein [Dichomitus squalens LYAD-421 SS1]EJF62089.1 FAD/NAD(P)-binding domain-containing protein [Dichomitus squalens LYAD-421 SS1]